MDALERQTAEHITSRQAQTLPQSMTQVVEGLTLNRSRGKSDIVQSIAIASISVLVHGA